MSETAKAKLSTKGQLVLPKAVREALGLQPNDTVLFLVEGNIVTMMAEPENYTEAMRGLHAGMWPDDFDRWLREERDAWDDETPET